MPGRSCTAGVRSLTWAGTQIQQVRGLQNPPMSRNSTSDATPSLADSLSLAHDRVPSEAPGSCTGWQRQSCARMALQRRPRPLHVHEPNSYSQQCTAAGVLTRRRSFSRRRWAASLRSSSAVRLRRPLPAALSASAW